MGSLYQRADGYWAAAVVIDGRRVVRYARTQSAAATKMAELERQALLGQAPPPNMTVGELVERWLAAESSQWKPRTRSDYRRIYEGYIQPELGTVRLSRLSPERLQRFFDRLREHPRQANKVYRLLHRVFVVGMRWGYVHVNPCDRIAVPAYRPPRIAVPSQAATERFVRETRDHRLWPWIMVAVTTGLRPGEQSALRWEDIDPDAARLHVRRTGAWIDGTWVETEPKTSAGSRVLSLSASTVAAFKRQRTLLEERRLAAGAAWEEHDFVFPGKNGRPMWISNIAPVLLRLSKQHGLGRITPHTLRHLHASLLLNQHVPLPLVSGRLGHANTQVTASIYSHAVGSDDIAASAIDTALGDVTGAHETH